MSQQQKRIAITIGDPAGIGPEITIKALNSKELPHNCSFVIIGDYSILKRAETFCKQQLPKHTVVTQPKELPSDNKIVLLDHKLEDPATIIPGKSQPLAGKAAYQYLLSALDLIKQDHCDALVTCPINKNSLKLAHIPFVGHTELFGHALDIDHSSLAMILLLDTVGVAHVTGHVSVRKAIDQISSARVFTTIQLLHETMTAYGISNPTIAIGGLNPHASEDGLFGTEEQEHIIPAMKCAQKQGIQVIGPLPPDTVFMRAFGGEFHGVVSMLHDHGYCALKSRYFSKCVQLTVGLPFIRTSVGHGTAFDRAGTGTASPESLLHAILAAHRFIQIKHSR